MRDHIYLLGFIRDASVFLWALLHLSELSLVSTGNWAG